MRPLGELTFTRVAGVPIAELRGELDLSNIGRIGSEIRALIGNTDPGLVVDLSGVTYLDSSALRLFFELDAQLRAHHQQLHLAVPGEAYIRSILRVSRLDERVSVHDAVAQAVAACTGREQS